MSSPRQITSWQAGRPERVRGGNFASSVSLRQHGQLCQQPLGHLEIGHLGDPVADVVETFDAEREADSPRASRRG